VRIAVLEHDAPFEDALHGRARVAEAERQLVATRDEDRFIRLFTDEEDDGVGETRLEDAAVAVEALVEKERRVAQQTRELQE